MSPGDCSFCSEDLDCYTSGVIIFVDGRMRIICPDCLSRMVKVYLSLRGMSEELDELKAKVEKALKPEEKEEST